jgi:hypothetical protein
MKRIRKGGEMLVIGSDKLGEPEERQGEAWISVPGILIDVVGWKARLYALYFLPESMRLVAEAVYGAFNPNITKLHTIDWEDGESVNVAGHIFVIDKSARISPVVPDLAFRWVDPNGNER